MRFRTSRRGALAVAFLAAGALSLSACSAGSAARTTAARARRDHVPDQQRPQQHQTAEALIKAFEAANPDITVKVETRPGGADGRQHRQDPAGDRRHGRRLRVQLGLAVPGDQPGEEPRRRSPTSRGSTTSTTTFKPRSSATERRGLRRAVRQRHRRRHPLQHARSTRSSASRSRRRGPSSWPTTRRSRRPASTRSIQTYGDTWTSQLFVLADYHNVARAEPDWAEKYTANQAKYATTRRRSQGFQHLQEVHKAGYLNKDYALGQVRRRPRGCWPPARARTTRC